MRNVKNYILVLVILFGFNSCSKDELEATIPSYISIDKFTISTNYSTQGTSSSNITDAWVYIDNDLVGIFELPAKFPVLKEGNVKIDVYPGIKENGISERRSKYIFYNAYSLHKQGFHTSHYLISYTLYHYIMKLRRRTEMRSQLQAGQSIDRRRTDI